MFTKTLSMLGLGYPLLHLFFVFYLKLDFVPYKYNLTFGGLFTGWVNIIHRSLARSYFVTGTSPDSLPNWKIEWFYVYMDGANWDEFFRPSSSKCVDGLIRDLKLEVDGA